MNGLQTAFNMRVKAFNTWTNSQNTLTKKREQETKLKAGGKPEKLTAVQHEVKEVTWLSARDTCHLPLCSGKKKLKKAKRSLNAFQRPSNEK